MIVKAVDGDSGLNGHIEYSLAQSPGCKFSINTTSGEVSVIGDLDRELVERVTIEVTASDKGQPSLSTSLCIRAIITDVNDNSPIFSQTTYTVTEDENIPPGSELLAVSATDLDEGRNGQVRYTTSSKHFAIDSVTGFISLFRNLDREQIPIYSFVVFATDDGSSPRSGTATVKVVLRDVNDFVPIFQPATMILHILENINKVPQVVYQLLGRDDDLDSNSELTYKISQGNEEGKFSLSTNGELGLLQILDREVQGEYTLLVTATDAVFRVEKRSGDAMKVGQVVPQIQHLQILVSIFVLSMGGTYSMEGEDAPFSIDLVSGEIITISTLDREVRENYTLLVTANDQSHTQRSTSSASLVVIIQDVNDNPPQFLDDPYVANVPAVLKRGTSGNQCDASSLGFEELSYMELPCLDPQNNTIYIEFATIKENALLLYNYDNNEGPEGEFLALEIVNGKMEFAYNLGDGTVRLQSTQQIADGNLHNVLATRIGKVGSLTVDNCTTNQPEQFCFASNPGTGTERTLDLDNNNMVFGGIKSIDPILLRPGHVRTDDFIGCIKELKLNNIPVKIAEALSSSNILTSCPLLDGACQDKACLSNCLGCWSFYLCQSPEGFTGTNCEKGV
ncbi:protocadherin Fat 4-like [Rhinoraja longicauda]